MKGAASPDLAAVEARIAAMPQPQRDTLLTLRATLRKVLPKAEECIKYNMPSFVVQGHGVAAYDAFQRHCSYFPFSGNVLDKVGDVTAGHVATKGTLQFPVDRPLPVALVRRLVRIRLDEISAVTKGKRFEFFDDGGVKAVGGMKDGLQHGAWRWYRKDGSLMRTGRFVLGEQTGVWETWDRAGNLVTSSRM